MDVITVEAPFTGVRRNGRGTKKHSRWSGHVDEQRGKGNRVIKLFIVLIRVYNVSRRTVPERMISIAPSSLVKKENFSFDSIASTLGRTRGEMPPPKVFLALSLKNKTSAPDVSIAVRSFLAHILRQVQ